VKQGMLQDQRCGSGFHCLSVPGHQYSLCKDLFVEAGNLTIEKSANKAHGCCLQPSPLVMKTKSGEEF